MTPRLSLAGRLDSLMWTRALCLALLVFGGPTSTWAAVQCCEVADSCCEDERPECPVRSGGECAISAAGHLTAALGPVAPLPAPAEHAMAAWRHDPPRPFSRAEALDPDEHPPRPPRTTILRN